MRSRPWHREALGLSPVFIVGDVRSGTSILYRSIQSHPRFTPAGGIQLVESNAMLLLLEVFRRRDVRWSQLPNFLLGLDALAAVAQDVEPLELRRRVIRHSAGAYVLPRGRGPQRAVRCLERFPAVWRAAGEHLVTRRYFVEAHRRRGAERLVEKTPTYIGWVRHLSIAFPRARFLFMIRHPLDVLSSYWKRFRADPEGSAWANIDVGDFSTRWEWAARRAAAEARRDTRFLLVRYEDFTARTGETVRRVLDHIGEAFDEACLLRDGEWKPTGPVPEGVRSSNPHLFGSVTEKTKRWDDYVDRPTAELLESRLAGTMELMGYTARTLDVRAGGRGG